jgi:hypothetical protein
MSLLLVLGGTKHSALLRDVGRTHRWCVGKSSIPSLPLSLLIGFFFLCPVQKKRSSNLLKKMLQSSQKGSGRANTHEDVVWKLERPVLSSGTRTKSSKSVVDGAVTNTQRSVDAWSECDYSSL